SQRSSTSQRWRERSCAPPAGACGFAIRPARLIFSGLFAARAAAINGGPRIAPAPRPAEGSLCLRARMNRRGALLIIFGEREVAQPRGLGQRLLGGKLLPRRLSIEIMHIRVHQTPPTTRHPMFHNETGLHASFIVR